jgi:hypothetical protein
LAASVPRDAVDEAVLACGKQARRSDGKLPPHVMVYFVMALALFADDDYEEVLTRLADPLRRWGCWDPGWEVPGSGGITQARQRLGYQPVEQVFEVVAHERERVLTAVRAGQDVPDLERARLVRVIEYQIPDRGVDGERELICLLTTITDPTQAPAEILAQAYHDRWEHETGNNQLKTCLRGPGRVLRSKSPDMVRQEIYGYLLTHYALSALICRAATEADIDPDQVKFLRTVRLVRRRIDDPAAFSPDRLEQLVTAVMQDIPGHPP